MRRSSTASIFAAALVACSSSPGDETARDETPGSSPAPTTPEETTCQSNAIDRKELLSRAQAFTLRHGIETTIAFDGCPPGSYATCEPVKTTDYGPIAAFLEQMDSELAIYPKDFFATIRLDYFVFGGELARNDRDHRSLGGAVVKYGDHRSVLIINTAALAYCYAPFNKRLAHHEIAHAIDFGFAGASEGTWWPALNPPGFAYGGVDPAAKDVLDVTHPATGFVTKYGELDAAEDYAEVYTALHLTEKKEDLRGWLADDAYVRTKFRAVIGALKTKWPELADALPNRDAVP